MAVRNGRRYGIGLVLTGLAVAAAAVLPNVGRAENDDGPGPVRTADDPVDVSKLMQKKLGASQRALGGLVGGDLKAVGKEAATLEAIARNPDWAEHGEDAVFEHFNVEFQRLSAKLGRMAETKNLEGAAYVYNQLTSTCISCHEHVRDVRKVPKIIPLGGATPSED